MEVSQLIRKLHEEGGLLRRRPNADHNYKYPIQELRETLDGDKCITFYFYDGHKNQKIHSDTFVITPETNLIRLKRNFIKALKKMRQ